MLDILPSVPLASPESLEMIPWILIEYQAFFLIVSFKITFGAMNMYLFTIFFGISNCTATILSFAATISYIAAWLSIYYITWSDMEPIYLSMMMETPIYLLF